MLEDASDELLAFYGYPGEHRPKLRSTNPLERVNKEIGRRSDLVGIYPNDEWLVQRRYRSERSIRQVLSERHQDKEVMTTQNKEVTELNAA